MYTLSVSIVVFSLVGCAHMFHTQESASEIARVCTPWVRQICRNHNPPLRCRGHQYQDASPVTPMCDFYGQRTCGITPWSVYYGSRLWNPDYCYQG